MTVSIIIPTFNRATLIGETLDSVLAQTYPHWECIVVDDGSTDGTQEVVQQYVEKDNRFRFYQRYREPKGAPTCRNIGLDNASGEYVMFLDSDDLLLNFALADRCKHLNESNADFIVSQGAIYIDTTHQIDKLVSTYTGEDALLHFVIRDVPWLMPSTLIKKEALLLNQLRHNEKIRAYQDIQFNLSLLSCELRFSYSKAKVDWLWRKHEKGNIGGDTENVESISAHINLFYIMRDCCVTLNKQEWIKYAVGVLLKKYMNYLVNGYQREAEVMADVVCQHSNFKKPFLKALLGFTRFCKEYNIPFFRYRMWGLCFGKFFYSGKKFAFQEQATVEGFPKN